MEHDVYSPEELSHEETARLVIDFVHRVVMHHAMWFTEVQQRFGSEKSWDILQNAFEKSYGIQTKRLGETLGFAMENGVPKPLLDLPRETLMALKENLAKNWLAGDGVWFQAVEFSTGMTDAKGCNDACWGRFSPFEAWCIRRFLDLPEKPGLDGLKRALGFRLYATLNRQSICEETPTSFVFQMNECRVQAARKRKGLADYHCKSAGIIEYPTFAEAIDARIRTECVGCPPDAHPEEWYCSWRFILEP